MIQLQKLLWVWVLLDLISSDQDGRLIIVSYGINDCKAAILVLFLEIKYLQEQILVLAGGSWN